MATSYFSISFAVGDGDVSAAGHHPGNDTHSVGKNDRAFGGRFPKLSGEYFIVKGEHKGQSDDVGSVGVIDDPVTSVCQLFLDLVIHQMCGQLACGTAAVYKTPAYAVFFTLSVDLDNGDAVGGIEE